MALLSLPVTFARLTYRAATFPARATVRLTFVVAEDVIDALRPAPSAGPADSDAGVIARRPPAAPLGEDGSGGLAPVRPAIARRPGARRGASTPGIEAPGERAAQEPVPPEPAPVEAHVDTEPTLVAESAEAGAQNGAGAEIRVEAPWSGYGRLRAREVIDRLPAQDEAALSVLLLYERSHRSRRSVMEAAERELRRRQPSSV